MQYSDFLQVFLFRSIFGTSSFVRDIDDEIYGMHDQMMIEKISNGNRLTIYKHWCTCL